MKSSILDKFYATHHQHIELALKNIRQNRAYSIKHINKKNGGIRVLNIPESYTKSAQSKLNNTLQQVYKPPKPVHAFLNSTYHEQRSIITNANAHTNKALVINVDIDSFFDSINFGRVRGLFMAKPYKTSQKVATKLAQLSTYMNKLPQGSPSSPVISNMICMKLDHQLIQLAKRHHAIYTRYADDITFSSDDLELNTVKLLKQINRVIAKNGFKLNPKKTRLQKYTQKQLVTGLKVNKTVNVDRKYLRELRSMLYTWHSIGLEQASTAHFTKYSYKHRNVKQSTHLSLFQRYKKAFYWILTLFTSTPVTKTSLPLTLLASSDTTQSAFTNTINGKLAFLKSIKGCDCYTYKKPNYTFQLLRTDYFLDKDLDIYEKIDYNNASSLQTIFSPVFDSILILTEGETDISYIKQALKTYQKVGKFTHLKLRFAYLEGWVNVANLHKAIFHTESNSTIQEISQKMSPYMNKLTKMFFVLDSDDSQLINYFRKKANRTNNFYLIKESEHGYIEKCFDANLIKSIVEEHGYKIDPKRSRDPKIKSKFEEHLKKHSSTEDFFSISSYIAFKKKQIYKTKLAKLITSSENVDYSEFEALFQQIANKYYT